MARARYEWTWPGTGATLNLAASVAGIAATRDQFIGWGPHVVAAWETATSHPFEGSMLLILFGLLASAHWERLIRLVGVRRLTPEPVPEPEWWATSQGLSTRIHEWLRPRGVGLQDKPKAEGVSFSIQASDSSRFVTIAKVDGEDFLLFSARVSETQTDRHAIVKGMSDNAYRAMQEDIIMEFARSGIGLAGAERIIEERGRAKNAEGHDFPVGAFFALPMPVNDRLNEATFMSAYGMAHRLVLILQVIISKHIRQEAARLGTPLPATIGDVPTVVDEIASNVTPIQQPTPSNSA